MKIKQHNCVLSISDAFTKIITSEIDRADIDDSSGIVLNFRDPGYSAVTGGYHPVEVAVSKEGRFMYITDFSYAGQGLSAELIKELDFDFKYEVFQQFGREYPINQGSGIYTLWQRNFVSYYNSGVFVVSVEGSL